MHQKFHPKVRQNLYDTISFVWWLHPLHLPEAEQQHRISKSDANSAWSMPISSARVCHINMDNGAPGRPATYIKKIDYDAVLGNMLLSAWPNLEGNSGANNMVNDIVYEKLLNKKFADENMEEDCTTSSTKPDNNTIDIEHFNHQQTLQQNILTRESMTSIMTTSAEHRRQATTAAKSLTNLLNLYKLLTSI